MTDTASVHLIKTKNQEFESENKAYLQLLVE